MTEPARFPDWSSLPERERSAASAQCRERLEQTGRQLHAVASICDPRPRNGGVLDGMPYVAKDMIATGCAEPSWGCAEPLMLKAHAAPVISRLDQAGALLIGTAEMTELAYEPSGINATRGNVLNPWNTDYAPGGSSSGPAALVAAGCCFAALGSDTGGSVRIPAHCCGVSGLKPSWGKIPVEGTMPLAPSLDTIGLIARGVADLALLWTALTDEIVPRPAGARSGVLLKDAFDQSDPEIAEICRAAIDVLGRCGMHINTCTGFPDESDENCLLIMQAEAARTHRARLSDERIGATLRKRLGKGLAISSDELSGALEARDSLCDRFLADQFGAADVILMPVMPIKTPRVAEVDPVSPEFRARTLYALSRFTRFVNYLRLPALAIPVGFDSRGLPVGLQLIGRPGSDVFLLAVGMMLQAETDWHSRTPRAIATDPIKEGLVA
jgi:aspartyl-tRNA(Asn)/glutamyl-tRNA(Gln) amidotransferase subunit A